MERFKVGMKNYEVDIYKKHCKKGEKTHYLGMILCDSSVEKVKLFAIEVVAGMTFEEVFEKHSNEGVYYAMMNNKKMNDILGWELADELFSVSANVLKE